MSRYDLKIDGTPYSVEILEISAAKARVRVNGALYEVELPAGAVAGGPVAVPAPTPPRPAPAAEAGSAPSIPPVQPPPLDAGKGEAVVAPMPGQILDVLVRQGDAVEVNAPVVMMEAMKMENEIRTHAAGRVVEVRVTKGQSVSVGEVLLIIG